MFLKFIIFAKIKFYNEDIFFLLILTCQAFAEIKQVKILGNKRVSSNTIENLIDKKVSNVDAIYINNLTRLIYNTDFFFKC